MEIKDLAGLSEPLTKLIEVTSKGIGHLSMPFQIKRIADAKAYEIEKISNALEENKASHKFLEYDGEKVKLICEQNQLSKETAREHAELTQNASTRISHREIKRQLNIENTIFNAAEDLSKEEEVSNEKVDDDWIARFFNIVEDISNEQMQNLWGNILSGEIKQPSTYSLRTLEVLRNISPSEAEIFCKVGELAIKSEKKRFILCDQEFLKNEMNISFVDMLLLRDLGLLYTNDLQFSFNPMPKNSTSFLNYANRLILVTRDEDTPQIPLQVTLFTQTGKELLNLVTQSLSQKYLEEICKKLRISDKIHTSYTPISAIANGRIHPAEMIEIK